MNLLTLPTFGSAGVFHVIVECPRGSTVKWKYQPALESFTISRPLVLGVSYPCDWGFIPSTRAGDGDPVDALVLWDAASYPGVVLSCRALAVMQVEQNRTDHDPLVRMRNDRVVAVPAAVRRRSYTEGLEAITARCREELEHFAAMATALEGKDVRVLGWSGAEAALRLIADAQSPA